jgi:hypothetical protein
MTQRTEERLRAAIDQFTETIEPAEDGWERIRAGTAARQHRPRWHPAIAAAAAAIVLAIIVAAVAAVRSDGGGSTSVDTPAAGSSAAPSEIVASTEDGRVVVLDTTTGAEVGSLAEGADAQTTITVTTDGARVFFDRPSSPASDPPREIVTVPTSGGATQRLIGGAGQPAVSPDGRLLAFVTYSPRTDQGQASGLNVVEIPETFDGWIPNVVGDGTVGETGQQISGLSWAPDSRRLVYTLLFSPQGSYPRIAESTNGIRLDQAPIVPINDGSHVAGYLGDTGQLLGRACVTSDEPDQRLRVIVMDPQSGQEAKQLFRYPSMCGSERLSSDRSGQHLLALGPAGLYRWSEGDLEPTKVANGVTSATWGAVSTTQEPTATTATTSTQASTTSPTSTSPTTTGPPPSGEEAAREEIIRAFTTWGAVGTADEAEAHFGLIDDPRGLRQAVEQSVRNYPYEVSHDTYRVNTVGFLNATEAAVDYDILMDGVPRFTNRAGHAVFVDGTWKITRDTACSDLSLSGGICPP